MNSKVIKAGILIILLVIPAFVFIFLKTFGDNSFSLPYYFPELDDAGKVIKIEKDTVFYSVPYAEIIYTEKDILEREDYSGIIILCFPELICDSLSKESIVNLERLKETFKNESNLKFLLIYSDDSINSTANQSLFLRLKTWKTETVNTIFYRSIIKKITTNISGFQSLDSISVKPNSLLIDTRSKVRGLYYSHDVNEMERLRLEIKVLKDIENDRK